MEREFVCVFGLHIVTIFLLQFLFSFLFMLFKKTCCTCVQFEINPRVIRWFSPSPSNGWL